MNKKKCRREVKKKEGKKSLLVWMDERKHQNLQTEILAGWIVDDSPLLPNFSDEALLDVAARATQRDVSSALNAHWCKAAGASTVSAPWRLEASQVGCTAAELDQHHPITFMFSVKLIIR